MRQTRLSAPPRWRSKTQGNAVTVNKTIALLRAGKLPRLCAALNELHNKPIGAWPETAQAKRRIAAELPTRSVVSLFDLIDRVFVVSAADRYQRNVWPD